MKHPQSPAPNRSLILILLFLTSFSAGFRSATDLGLSWDEANFIASGIQYAQACMDHLGGRSKGPIAEDPRWQWTWEHPPFIKMASGLSLATFANSMTPLVAARLPNLILWALLPVAAYLLAEMWGGAFAGTCAGGLVCITPRLFGQGTLVELDLPLSTLSLFVVFFGLRAGQGPRILSRSMALTGVLLGTCMLTKFSALFLLPSVLLACWAGRRDQAGLKMVSIVAIASLVVLAGWPFLWHHPAARFAGYLGAKFHQDLVPVCYLGTTYTDRPAPWHYPFVCLWATTPACQVVFSAWGIASCLRRRAVPDLLLITTPLFFILPCVQPSVGKYDGVRLFLPAVGFIAVLAGIGLARAAAVLHARLSLPLPLLPCVAILACVPGFLAVYPQGLAYYGRLVGGPRGALELGFESTYWGEALTPRLIRTIHERWGIHRFAAFPVGENVPGLSQNFGLLPKGVEWVYPGTNEEALALICRQGMFEPLHRFLYDHGRPLIETSVKGAPLVQVFSKDEIDRAKEAIQNRSDFRAPTPENR